MFSNNKVPSSLVQVGITIKYTFLNYFRSRRSLLTLVVGYYRPEDFMASDLAFYSSWWGTSVTFVIVLSGVFFGGDAISGEFQNKTGYFMLPNPIRRSSIYVGKWLSAFIASTIILSVFTAITVGNGMFYFLAAVLGFTFFFSSVFKSSSMSILVTTILFLFVFTLIQNLVAGLVQIEPWFILTYGAQIIGNVLMVPYPPPSSLLILGPGSGNTLITYNAAIHCILSSPRFWD